MRKLVLFFVSLLTFSMACNKTQALSISGRINCPSRAMTRLNPADYIVYLVDSLDAGKPNAGKQIQPNADCTYAFDNLELGHTYFMNVANVTPGYSSKLALSSTALENFLKTNTQPLVFNLTLLAADINGDGIVDSRDLDTLKDYISGKTTTLPTGFWRFQRVDGLDARNSFIFVDKDPLVRMKKSLTNFDFIQVQLSDVELTKCN